MFYNKIDGTIDVMFGVITIPNILDYLAWRGDITLANAPFNEVDSLIFSQLSYVSFAGIVTENDDPTILTIKEAADRYFELHPNEGSAPGRSFAQKPAYLMKQMAMCARFGSLKLLRYVDMIDYEEEKQFSAITVDLGDGSLYIAYRGTDNTLIGWKEDFNLSFKSSVPAQREAVRYLEAAAAGNNSKLIVGGHSKGGNLAVYAAVKCDSTVKERIISVYNHDGPGFGKEISSSDEYREMLGRIRTIVPQSSVVGMLMEHDEEYTIVKSDQMGLMQHNAFSWEVMGARFIHLESVTKGSRMLDEALKKWLESTDDAQREKVVDGLFSVFSNTGAATLSELSSDVLRNAGAIVRSMHTLDPDTKKIIQKTIKALLVEGRHVFISEISGKSRSKDMIQS